MSVIDSLVPPLDRVVIELIQKFDQVMDRRPSEPQMVACIALGICRFWLGTVKVSGLDAAARAEIERALIDRLTRRFALLMDPVQWQSRENRDEDLRNFFTEASQQIVENVGRLFKQVQKEHEDGVDPNTLFDFGMFLWRQMVDWPKVIEQSPTITPEELAHYYLQGRDLMLLVLESGSLVSAAISSVR